MSRFLPVLILLFVICYLLFVSPSFAQTSPPTQTNAFEDFMKNLIPDQFKKIPDTLQQVNCSGLPLSVCTGIQPQISPNALKPQAASNTTSNQVTVGNAAGQYIIASGIHTPPEVAEASTDIFSSIIAAIAGFFESLFPKGEQQAKNYAGTVLPAADNIGIEAGGSAMDKSLPLVQCSQLPAGLCTDNKPNAVQ